MPRAPSSSTAQSAEADTTAVDMLRTAALCQACAGAWTDVIRATLFTVKKPDKAEVARRKELGGYAALLFLQVLWKETGPVTEADLRQAGMERTFSPDEVTCHGMAVEAAVDKKENDKLDKRVRAIMGAAKHYGLVEETMIGAKKKALRATDKLHELLNLHHETVEKILSAVPEETCA